MSGLEILRHQAALLDANSYLVVDREEQVAMVIDPAADLTERLEGLLEEGITLEAILLTHGHFDHIAGAGLCKELWPGAKVMVHRADSPIITDPVANLSQAFIGQAISAPPADRVLEEGDRISCGSLDFQILATPGHSPGSICCLGHGYLFSGDTLFCGGYGRTDLPGGSGAQLYNSLHRLAQLPGNLQVLPGHGPGCTLAQALQGIGVGGWEDA